MKDFLILSPSKEMDWSPGTGRVALDPVAEMILAELRKMDVESLAKFFAIKEDLAEKLAFSYEHMEEPTAKAAKDTYRGIAFRQMDPEVFGSDFAREHLVILSALYGPVAPDFMMQPYRLDFTKSLKIEGQSLKSLQRKHYSDFFAGCRVFDLASGEFSSLIDKKKVGRWISIDFYIGKKKAPSATAKKLRGMLASHVLSAESFVREVFESFSGEGFFFSPESDEEHFIYRNN